MSSFILENLLNNINNKNEKVEFDLTKSITTNQKRSIVNYDQSPIPIKPKRSDWEMVNKNNEKYLFKEFEFANHKHMIYFIIESLKYANKVKHHPEILITHKNLKVKLTTKELNDVTELDIDMSKFMKDIYEDILFIE